MTLVDCFTLLMARIQDFQRQPENASPEDLSRNLDQLKNSLHAVDNLSLSPSEIELIENILK